MSPHAGFHRAERMLDCLSTLAHGLWVCIKALLHGLEQILMLPCNSPLGKAQCEQMFSALPPRADIALRSACPFRADIVAKVFLG